MTATPTRGRAWIWFHPTAVLKAAGIEHKRSLLDAAKKADADAAIDAARAALGE